MAAHVKSVRSSQSTGNSPATMTASLASRRPDFNSFYCFKGQNNEADPGLVA